MIDNEQRRETWQRYGNRPSSSLTSDIPSNEPPPPLPPLPQTVPAFGRLLIQLRLLYYLAAIACVRIYLYLRACASIYIYILNFFVICLAHGERPLQHVESRLTVANTLHREDNPWFQRVCHRNRLYSCISIYYNLCIFYTYISLIHIYIWNNPRF